MQTKLNKSPQELEMYASHKFDMPISILETLATTQQTHTNI